MNKSLFAIAFFLLALLLSCEEKSPLEDTPVDSTRNHIALVLCEGLWGFNNTTVSRIKLDDFSVINDFVGLVNPNFKIGDVGNDLIIKGDTFFIVVTTSKILEFFQLSTGKLLGYITFEGNSAPRRIAFLNDSICVVTDLYKDCVYLVNINSRKVQESIFVGPAPEFVVVNENFGYVINSGYGDYRADEPKAGTISIIDFRSRREVQNILVGPNPVEAVLAKDLGFLFVAYYNLPSLFSKDSLGGIVAFELKTMKKIWEFKTNPRSLFYDDFTQKLYFINDNKICFIDPMGKEVKTLIQDSKPNENWYSIAVHSKRNIILVGNAFNFTVDGSILVYSLIDPTNLIKKISVGVNPSKIVLVND